MNRLPIWTKSKIIIAVSLGLVAMLSALYLYETGSVGEKKMTVQTLPISMELKDARHSKEYILEVIGLGVTLDKYRQGALWDAIAKGSPYSSIRDMDPSL